MQDFMTEIRSALKDLKGGQQVQNEKIDVLTRSVSQLREIIDLYVHKVPTIKSGITSSPAKVLSTENEEDAVEKLIIGDNDPLDIDNSQVDLDNSQLEEDQEENDPLDLDNSQVDLDNNQVEEDEEDDPASPTLSTEESIPADDDNIDMANDSMEKDETVQNESSAKDFDMGNDNSNEAEEEEEGMNENLSSSANVLADDCPAIDDSDFLNSNTQESPLPTAKVSSKSTTRVTEIVSNSDSDKKFEPDSIKEKVTPKETSSKNISESDSDNEDLSTKLQKRKKKKKKTKTRRSPVVSDKSEDEDNDDDELKTSTKKKPTKMTLDDLVISSSSSSKADKVGEVNSDEDKLWKDDPKLDPKCSYVSVTHLPQIIMDRLSEHNYIVCKVDDDDDARSSRKGRRKKEEDPLHKAIRELCAFNPIKSIPVDKPSSSKTKKNRKKEADQVRLRADDSSDDDFMDAPPRVGKKSALLESSKNYKDVCSDDEDLDGVVELSDTDKKVKNKLSKESEDGSEKDIKTKKSSGDYFTPAVCKLRLDKDSDASSEEEKDEKPSKRKKEVTQKDSEASDSSDGDIKPIRKRNKNRITKINSESDDDVLSCSDSDSDFQEKQRKRKRRHSSSSDVINLSSDDSDFVSNKKTRSSKQKQVDKKKKPKRTKKFSDSEDSSDSKTKDAEESPSKGGRRDIRAILSKKDLRKTTRQAQDEEQKRKQRIIERQKMFNEFSTESVSLDVVLEKLDLDIDKTTKEPLISLDSNIVKKLKPHQAKGINFLWDSCFESLEQYKKEGNEGSGCILAHCMGLGKTLQSVGFLHAVMTSQHLEMKTTLVICPLNTVGNWANEIKLWLRDINKKVYVHKLYMGKNLIARVEDLEAWQRRGGIGIMHYDRFRELVGEGKRVKKNLQPRIRKCLLDPGPDIVICDEAHIIKNCKSKISLAINQIRTKRRILLTGTPLQNNLIEYHTMMQFVKPNLLGSIKEFRNRFVNPITNGQHRDSDEHDVRVMKKRAHVLHKLLDGCVQRLDYTVLVPYLPPKYEYVLLIKLTEVQKKLYKHYLDSVMDGEGSLASRVKQRKFLADFAMLSKVWSHPYALCMNDDKDSESESAGSLKDFIDDDVSTPEGSTSSSDDEVAWLDDELETIPKKKAVTEVEKPTLSSTGIIEKGGDWWSQFFKPKDDIGLLEHGSKLVLLFEILKTCESIGDKVLVFSQSLKSLNIIENFLEDLNKEARKRLGALPFGVEGENCFWRKNREYYRIDGSTKTEDRQKNCDTFNTSDFNKAKLFLISTRAGGLGINLIGANRVVIFDASWNPSQDLQSIFRVFRFGQTKPCYIYRFLAEGTMEEKVYNRQVVKLSLSGRVIDEHQIERHFKFDDILKMYQCDFEEKSDRPTPAVPKDRLLADLLISHKHLLDNYLEHDSLLVNQTDEGLTEEERQAAWNEYHQDKDVQINRHASMMNAGRMNNNNDVSDKIRQRLRVLYPYLSEMEMQRYIFKVNTDITSLKIANQNYLNGYAQITPTQQQIMIENLHRKRDTIQRYLSEPNLLANEMLALQYTQIPNLHSINSGGGGIRLAPMSSILEPSSQESVYANSMNSIVQNMIRNAAPRQTYQRAGILNRNRTIPTTTVPYNPNANTASSSNQQ